MPIYHIDNGNPSHARQIRKNVGNKVCKAYYKLMDQKLKSEVHQISTSTL